MHPMARKRVNELLNDIASSSDMGVHGLAWFADGYIYPDDKTPSAVQGKAVFGYKIKDVSKPRPLPPHSVMLDHHAAAYVYTEVSGNKRGRVWPLNFVANGEFRQSKCVQICRSGFVSLSVSGTAEYYVWTEKSHQNWKVAYSLALKPWMKSDHFQRCRQGVESESPFFFMRFNHFLSTQYVIKQGIVTLTDEHSTDYQAVFPLTSFGHPLVRDTNLGPKTEEGKGMAMTTPKIATTASFGHTSTQASLKRTLSGNDDESRKRLYRSQNVESTPDHLTSQSTAIKTNARDYKDSFVSRVGKNSPKVSLKALKDEYEDSYFRNERQETRQPVEEQSISKRSAPASKSGNINSRSQVQDSSFETNGCQIDDITKQKDLIHTLAHSQGMLGMSPRSFSSASLSSSIRPLSFLVSSTPSDSSENLSEFSSSSNSSRSSAYASIKLAGTQRDISTPMTSTLSADSQTVTTPLLKHEKKPFRDACVGCDLPPLDSVLPSKQLLHPLVEELEKTCQRRLRAKTRRMLTLLEDMQRKHPDVLVDIPMDMMGQTVEEDWDIFSALYQQLEDYVRRLD